MKDKINIPIQEMTPDLMKKMEKEGLIIRICPHHDDIETPFGETWYHSLYEGKDGFGPHKIIAITVNREMFPGFGTHHDNEEFLLIGDNNCRPMYILIARMQRDIFEKKVKENSLNAEDFYLVKAKFNDPEVSFFSMNTGIPHGEGILPNDSGEMLPSFYVTESRELPLDLCGFGNYEIVPEGN
ncbi:MAG: hypothetical protein K5989_12310 [Lachnospiraceae bacterium]|nr:hypothetical protein [Lachnospiraceae bacterium]